MVQRAGADPAAFAKELALRTEGLPQVSGGSEPSFGRRTVPLLSHAEDEAKRLKDDYISVEHFLLAAVKHDKDVQAVADRHGLSYDKLVRALAEIRGAQRVTDQNPEGKFQALEKYTRDLTASAKRGKIGRPTMEGEDKATAPSCGVGPTQVPIHFVGQRGSGIG